MYVSVHEVTHTLAHVSSYMYVAAMLATLLVTLTLQLVLVASCLPHCTLPFFGKILFLCLSHLSSQTSLLATTILSFSLVLAYVQHGRKFLLNSNIYFVPLVYGVVIYPPSSSVLSLSPPPADTYTAVYMSMEESEFGNQRIMKL